MTKPAGITNLNARVLTDGTIFAQYQEEGRAKDGSFPTWSAFTAWLAEKCAPPSPKGASDD